MKLNKSILKRIKITKTGKMLCRPLGQNHFRAKHSSNYTRKKRKGKSLSKTDIRPFVKYLNMV